jgi:hypothetical protein
MQMDSKRFELRKKLLKSLVLIRLRMSERILEGEDER